MFVLKKTYENLLLTFTKYKADNDILRLKVENLTSELDVAHNNLSNLEKELNGLKGYITFLKMQHNIMSYDDFIKTQKSTQDKPIVPKKVQPPLTRVDDVPLPSTVQYPPVNNSLLVSYDGDIDYNNKFNKLNETIKEVSENIENKCRSGEVNFTSFYDDTRHKNSVESSSYSYCNDSSSSSDTSSSSSSSCSSSCD